MLRKTLNLGILAHVDAGKTTLTERLLYAAGLIDEIGSVDKGTTQTDFLALERQRGITIRSAVASFAVDDVTVNLIDTPGHPEFIAEVERVLNVLDGVVLVVAAVEGVQAQTRVLMRALQRLRIPTIVFVNKVDRRGADCSRVLDEIHEKLTPAAVALGTVIAEGTREADFVPYGDRDRHFASRLAELLAEENERLLAAYVADETGIPAGDLRAELASQTKEALVYPVFLGSALTGAGLESLTSGIRTLLPAAAGDRDGPVSAGIFKVERAGTGEKVAYARVFTGTIRVRDRLRFRRTAPEDGDEGKVTAIAVFEGAAAVPSASVAAGEIAKLWGLAAVRVGDAVGERGPSAPVAGSFAPPTLESVVVARDPDDTPALFVALEQLAEQDPLIDVRRDDARREIAVSLYGEVQKEVIQATLALDYGVEADFRDTTPIYIERPLGSGEAIELLNAETNPFSATVGLRVEPRPADSGVEVRTEVDHRTVPLYVFKNLDNFAAAMDEYVRDALQEGLFGWRVTDCVVTMFASNYASADGPPSTRGPMSTAADFRKLTPMVLMQALQRAGTAVCEPTVHVRIELPARAMGAIASALTTLGGSVETPSLQGTQATLGAVLPALNADRLQRRLAGLTGGEGSLESSFAGYQTVVGERPTRRRTTPNPLDPAEYTRHVGRRVTA